MLVCFGLNYGDGGGGGGEGGVEVVEAGGVGVVFVDEGVDFVGLGVDLVVEGVEFVDAGVQGGLFAVEGGDIVAEGAVLCPATKIGDVGVEAIYACLVAGGSFVYLCFEVCDFGVEGFGLGAEGLEFGIVIIEKGDNSGAVCEKLGVVSRELAPYVCELCADDGMKLVVPARFFVVEQAIGEGIVIFFVDDV